MLDQVPRLLQAMYDIASELGHLSAALQIALLMQMLVQGRWWSNIGYAGRAGRIVPAHSTA